LTIGTLFIQKKVIFRKCLFVAAKEEDDDFEEVLGDLIFFEKFIKPIYLF
jgi:hypothetical protein